MKKIIDSPSILINRKKDIYIIVTILTIPLIGYIHNFIPRIKTIDAGIFLINSGYFKDIQAWSYILGIKLIGVVSFSIWYVTCKHWWRAILLVPLVYFVIQFYIAINNSIINVEELDFFIGFLCSIPIIILLLYISKKLNYYSRAKKLSEEMDQEIAAMLENIASINQKIYENVKLKFKILRQNKSEMSKEIYLRELVALKYELNQSLPDNMSID